MIRTGPAGRPLRRWFAAAAGALLFSACDGIAISGPVPWPDDLNLDGFWEGQVQQGRFEMTLFQATPGQTVSGAGAWIPVAGSRAFRVEGVISEEARMVTLLLELSPPAHSMATAPILVHYRARPWGHNQLRGRLNGGGFDDALLVLRRTRAPVV